MKQVLFQNYSKTSIPKTFVVSRMKSLRRLLLKRLPSRRAQRLRKATDLIVVFVDNSKMKALNSHYRKKNYVTDVLSFESEDTMSLGELILAPSQLKTQSKSHRLSYHEELLYMLIHGVLHLLGYDHEQSQAEAKLMFELQDEAFESLSRIRVRAKK